MKNVGWTPPPVDLVETLSSYDTTTSAQSKIDNITNLIYPINSVQVFQNNIDPNTKFPSQKWELIDSTWNYTTLLNNYFQTSGLNLTVDNDGVKWLLLVSHNINSGSNYYSGQAQALSCSTSGKISNLYIFNRKHDILKNSKGQYEFKLEYPELGSGKKNQWRQTSNPLMMDNIAFGSQALYTSWPVHQSDGRPEWTFGLSLAGVLNPQCFLKGDLYCPYWWFAICSYQNYEGGIPGPGSVTKGYTNLYVRVPGLETSDNLLSTYNFLYNKGYKHWKRIA